MYFLLTLFFASLLGIVFMVGRKLLVLEDGQLISSDEKTFIKTPHWEAWRHITVKKIKQHGYAGLVKVIRIYVKSSNTLKNKYHETKKRIDSLYARNLNGGKIEKKEVSKFLRMMSDYKQKIGKIKNKIKEEEEITPP